VVCAASDAGRELVGSGFAMALWELVKVFGKSWVQVGWPHVSYVSLYAAVSGWPWNVRLYLRHGTEAVTGDTGLFLFLIVLPMSIVGRHVITSEAQDFQQPDLRIFDICPSSCLEHPSRLPQ
jgi:hypothetical protein